MQIDSISSVPAFDATAPLTPAAHASGSGSAKVTATESGSSQLAAGVSAAGGSVPSGSAMETAHGVSYTPQATTPAPVQGVINGGEEALAAVYTTSVAGHSYLGTVEQAAGQYVASVADPPRSPITGIGSSIQAAEQNLTVLIDERV